MQDVSKATGRLEWLGVAEGSRVKAGDLIVRLENRDVQAQVEQANQRAAQVAVDQTLIHAPFDGVVLTKTANGGDVITPFSSASESKGAVVTMADMETLEVDVSEANLSRIRIGQPCEIQLDAFAAFGV